MLARQPEASFILDADPQQARARKPEYPLEFLHENRNAYLQLSRFLDGMTVIPPLPLPKAKTAVVRHVLGLLPARDAQAAAPAPAPVAALATAQKELDGQAARPMAS